MLSDPQTVTIDGSARALPRVSVGGNSSTPRTNARTSYRTADGTYSVATQQLEYRDGSRRAEITLRKLISDSDNSDLFVGQYLVGVGLTFDLGPRGLGASEVANIRTALLAYVDSTLQGRLFNGES
jgi:hypothetical protein